MMFLHELPDVRNLFLTVSNEKSIDPFLIEKDYWIMHALWGLQQQRFVFELKGGTSLSKGFKVIDRFSEDIDIKIEPNSGEQLKTGKNDNKPRDIDIRRQFFDSLANKISIPEMSASREISYDDARMRNGGINLSYDSFFESPKGIKPNILLEVGFDQTTPNETVTIDSWAYFKAIDSDVNVTDNRAKEIKCYCPEYTFCRKTSNNFNQSTKTNDRWAIWYQFLKAFL